MRDVLRRALSRRQLQAVRRAKAGLRRRVARVRYGGGDRFCPVCETPIRTFIPFRGRSQARCPICESLERHRLIWLYLRARTDLFDGRAKSLLHVAPEPELSARLATVRHLRYVTADLAPHAMVQLDVTRVPFADESFDVIYASHVLEHVEDDTGAMREFRRVLRPGGWAILQVPMFPLPVTLEDPAVRTPEDRERVYGQWDHVRMYGRDYADRLGQAGFGVTADGFVQSIATEEVERMGLVAEDIYLCR
jgi:SAM-dependent methyltransferase